MKFLFLLLFSLSSYAYVISKGDNGRNLKWVKQDNKILLYINPNPIGNNISAVSANQIVNVFQESIDDWNQYSPFELVPNYTTSLNNKNTVSFSDDPTLFGSEQGVVAITEVNYNANTGVISSADIYINESYVNKLQFTVDESQSSNLKAYLGDVFTHELGHFLGLSHSEVIGSSMVYSIFKNQHTVHSDDFHGVWDNYNSQIYPGTITGIVMGGQSVEVFGVNVFLIDTSTMQVVQSQISSTDGSFIFKNVDKSKSYIIYTAPLKDSSRISNFYSTVVDTYCAKGSTFKQSFYTECSATGSSRPQGIKFEDGNTIDVGIVTIRCDENINPQYLALKEELNNREFQLVDSYKNTSFIFSGFFTSDEVSSGLSGKGDEFEVDLRSTEIDNPEDFVLKINTASTGLGSSFDFYVLVKRNDEAGYKLYLANKDETGKTLTDQEILLPLSSSSGDNLFSVKVYPMSLTTTQKYEIFSVLSQLNNPTNIYLISAQVGSYVGNDFVPYQPYGDGFIDDNALCLDTAVSFTTQAYTPLSASNASQLKPDDAIAGAVSCATVDFDHNDQGPSGGMMSFLLGVMSVFFIRFIINRRSIFVY